MTEPTGVEVATVDQDPRKRHPMMPGQSTDLEERYSQVAMTPETFQRARQVLIQFIADNLVEATYDKGGYPEQVNDYYVVPGSDKKALSRKGADSLSDLYKYKILHMDEVRSTVEKDYCSITYKCTLHRSGVIVAERDATASSAEKAIQRSAKKYTLSGKKDPDWRSAENDIRAKAQKRAFVQAVIHACNATDILAAADDPSSHHVEDAEFEDVTESPKPASNGGPTVEQLKRATKLLTHRSVSPEEREKFADWINKPTCTKDWMEEQLALLEDRIHAHDEAAGPIT